VDCQDVREAISAMLDGEPPGADQELVEDHLAGCAECRRWRERAHEVTRRARLVAAGPVRGPSAALVRELASEAPASDPLPPARVALVGVGVAQLVATAPALVFGTDHDAPLHVAHEMGSFDVALAIGFLAAAWRPVYAAGMRPLVGAAALLLAVTAVIDVLAARTTLVGETPHLLAVAGWLLLGRLAAFAPSPGRRAARGPRRPALADLSASAPSEEDRFGQATRRAPGQTGAADARRAAHG
jgi:predicted anti-sigma-YlaC factor YlaD